MAVGKACGNPARFPLFMMEVKEVESYDCP
jgi:hypothetical protein